MIRVEIVSNQSVQDDIVEVLEQELPSLEYTLIPGIQGKGKSTKKLGDPTWPEMNFLLFTFVSEEDAKKINFIVKQLIQKYPREGISIFFSQGIEY